MSDIALYGGVRADSRLPQSVRMANALETGRTRLLLVAFMFTVGFLVVAARLVDVMAMQTAGGTPGVVMAGGEVLGQRADILDRNGVVLATSVPIASLFADASLIGDADQVVDLLAPIIPDLNQERARRLLATDRRFVWVHRRLTPSQQERINRLGIPGLDFGTEQRRIYPLGSLMAHVLGATDIDGHGIAGIESSMDEDLMSGAPVRLTIDVRLQEILRQELAQAIDEFRAIGGAGVVMDVRTGELLALASLPDYDPDEIADADADALFNRATLGIYEMGSTFKIFTTAMALDSGATTIAGTFDATHPIQVGRFTINDFHAQARWLTVPEIFRYSSNIGSVRMALAVGTARQQAYLRALGLLEPAPLELPEVGAPLVPEPWREINTMTISFGHGLAVSPVQLVSAVSTVVNGGIRHPATLVPRDPTSLAGDERVISETTSDLMRRLLRLVVTDGTGRNADAEGYLVGGKTGTAEKPSGGGYNSHALISSFVAAFPMNDPRYVVFIMLDEPHGNEQTYGYATGGWVAAPAVRQVIERMGPLYGIAPVDEDAPEIREALAVPGYDNGHQLAAATQ
ncbi:MAG: penicillin-binding protein 2 [Rhodospirillaceae bacterium]|nr:penicillin-binding protein 2 [Rhodospirillaceae bacterium]